MPKGPFGFSRFTSIGPFVREEDDALYHITRQPVLENVLTDGIKKSVVERFKNIDDSGMSGAVGSHTILEYFFDYFKPESMSHLPNRANSVFFFNNTRMIENKLLSLKQSDSEDATARTAVLAVDPDKISCKGAKASLEDARTVVNTFYDELLVEVPLPEPGEAPDKSIAYDAFDEYNFSQQQQKMLTEYWNSVTAYDGYASGDDEIWFDCDIPPEAINSIITREGLQ